MRERKCYINNCNKLANRGFMSKNNKLQKEVYCYEHAKEIKKNGAFPNCKLTYFKQYVNFIKVN